ncbi:MAG: dodecin domain-containing protein, partial [Pyrinomonadaceae bacterium]
MSVAKNIEITSTSKISFEDAINTGIQRASQTIN